MPTDLSTRIKNIQKQIDVPLTGVIDLATCQSLEQNLGISLSSSDVISHIKRLQQALNIGDDGIVGPITISRIEALISPKLPGIPVGASLVVSANSVNAIINFEVSSPAYYDKKYQKPIWPHGESGVTIGIGYDCGYCTKEEFRRNWGSILSENDLNTMLNVVGLKGDKAKAALASCQSVVIPFSQASTVFYQSTLPIYAGRTKRAYKGVEKLPPDAQGALLSLVYNRGAAINDKDSRREMKNLVNLVAAGDLKGMANEFRNMKRLWPNYQGLIDRREKEANLVENATYYLLPEQLAIV